MKLTKSKLKKLIKKELADMERNAVTPANEKKAPKTKVRKTKKTGEN